MAGWLPSRWWWSGWGSAQPLKAWGRSRARCEARWSQGRGGGGVACGLGCGARAGRRDVSRSQTEAMEVVRVWEASVGVSRACVCARASWVVEPARVACGARTVRRDEVRRCGWAGGWVKARLAGSAVSLACGVERARAWRARAQRRYGRASFSHQISFDRK